VSISGVPIKVGSVCVPWFTKPGPDVAPSTPSKFIWILPQNILPGIDNRLVAFRARDGEQVTVTPKNSGTGGVGPTNIVFNVVTRDADSFLRSQSQLQNRALAGIAQARRRR